MIGRLRTVVSEGRHPIAVAIVAVAVVVAWASPAPGGLTIEEEYRADWITQMKPVIKAWRAVEKGMRRDPDSIVFDWIKNRQKFDGLALAAEEATRAATQRLVARDRDRTLPPGDTRQAASSTRFGLFHMHGAAFELRSIAQSFDSLAQAQASVVLDELDELLPDSFVQRYNRSKAEVPGFRPLVSGVSTNADWLRHAIALARSRIDVAVQRLSEANDLLGMPFEKRGGKIARRASAVLSKPTRVPDVFDTPLVPQTERPSGSAPTAETDGGPTILLPTEGTRIVRPTRGAANLDLVVDGFPPGATLEVTILDPSGRPLRLPIPFPQELRAAGDGTASESYGAIASINPAGTYTVRVAGGGSSVSTTFAVE